MPANPEQLETRVQFDIAINEPYPTLLHHAIQRWTDLWPD
jgi:hypothetical protein